MEKAHGGDRRSNAFRAAKGLQPQDKTESPPPKVSAEPKKPSDRPISMEDLAHFMRMSAEMRQLRANNRPRSLDWCPYRMEAANHQIFPARAMPPKKSGLRMAQDSALVADNQFAVQAWMGGGMLSNVASEGLLFLGYPYLSELAQRPEYRLFGEIRSQEMIRKWTKFRGTHDKSTEKKDEPRQFNKDDESRQGNGNSPRSDNRNKEIEEKIKELEDFEKDLKIRAWFQAAAAQDSFFGISHLFLETAGIDPDDLSDPELQTDIGDGRSKATQQKVGKGFLKGLRTIEPIWCYPTTYNAQNPLLRSWYDPQVWYVMGTEIHKSRLLTMIGRPVPDILKPAYAFGGLSMTQMAQPYVDIWLRTRESVGEIIHAYSVMVLKTKMSTRTMPGGSGGGNGDVLARMSMFMMGRDNQGLFVLDKDTEDFANVSVPLGTLDQLQAQSQEHLCSVARIPLVKYTGIQPKGLNATSEGEMRAFNDTIHGEQEHLFRTALTTVYDLMQISLWGARDPDITYDFEPLHEMTEKEKSEVRKLEAETDQIRIDSSVVSPEEVRRKVVADKESGFESLDPEDVPDLLLEEAHGLEPRGGKPQAQEAEAAEEAESGIAGEDGLDDLESALDKEIKAARIPS